MTPEQIKNLREELGRTQEAMATIVDTTKTTWWRWENGLSSPTKVYLNKLHKLRKFVDTKKGEDYD